MQTFKNAGLFLFSKWGIRKSISTYSRLVVIKPGEVSAYYYRGKARLNIANDPKESLNSMRENFYTASIKDFTKAIEISVKKILKCCKIEP